jgi:hypothetical protein
MSEAARKSDRLEDRFVTLENLALQLPFFEMSALRGGLMDSAPE